MIKKPGCLLISFFWLINSFSCFAQNAATDSLLRLLKSAKDDTNKVNLLYELSEIAADDEDFYQYAQQSLALAEKLHYAKGIGNAYNNIGGYYYNKIDLPLALEFYNKGLVIREKTGDKYGISQSLNNIGTVYEIQGNIVSALEYYIKSLKIREELGVLQEVAVSYNNIGLLYKTQGEISKAFEYLKKSLLIRENINDKTGIANSLNNIGYVNLTQGNYDTALVYYEKSAQLNNELGYKKGYGQSLNNIGLCYQKQGIHEKALSYFSRSLNILQPLGDKLTMSSTLNNLAINYLGQQQYKKAEDYGRQSLTMAKEIGAPDKIKSASETLSKIYSEQGNFKEALNMYVLFKQMSDSINNVETRKSSLKKQMQYEAGKREQQITLLNKDKEIQKKEINQQTLFRNAAIIISLFLFIIGFLFFNRARTNKKYAKVLEEKNKIIQQEKEKAVRSELYKTQFLANMSHEIRTPLHAITGMINVLNQRSPRPDQSAYLNVMRKSADNLIGIINNVLDISKIEAGKIDFEKIVFSPAETIDTVIHLLQANALDKGLYLKSDIINIPDFVEGDQVRLTQVIINLIGNAVKFTAEGGITVTAQALNLQTAGAGKCFLQFSITDTGVGIQEDKLEKIFESFSQADEGITRKYGGTGLGLTISKQLIELQGGNIHVTSKPGHGTTFSFMIPYGIVNNEVSRINNDIIVDTTHLNGSSILIVEDNYYNRVVATETLNLLLQNLVIDEAENGKIALEKIALKHYDFIFMDLQMPEMDGYTAMSILKEKMQTHISSSLIIGLSANSSADEKDKCLAAGMNDYLSKPFNPKELLKVMLSVKEKVLV